MTGIEVRLLSGFEAVDPATWARLLEASPTREVFQTREWLSTWWECFGRGRLLLLVAGRGGAPTALAPLFADGQMVFPVGAGGSDYLDLLGEAGDPEVLEALLAAARDATPGFLGFRLYHVPDDSPTGEGLARAARRLGLEQCEEYALPAPRREDPGTGEALREAAGKRSLVRHARGFEREGGNRVVHLRDGREILPHLPAFFAQHVARWEGTGHPSVFLDPAWRRFYERLSVAAADAGWLRFTRVESAGIPIAFHFGFSFRGSFLWYKPAFDPVLARRSPGEVLLRHLLLAAADEGARVFDLGLGAEAFKDRFATAVRTVRTWGLYPVGTRP